MREVPGSIPGTALLAFSSYVKDDHAVSHYTSRFWQKRVCSSAVERLTADQQVPGSNPGAPFLTLLAQRLAIAPDAGLRMQVQVVK